MATVKTLIGNVRGPQGPTGATGATGAAGRGIQSVVQTSTSSAPGGENIVTVTFTDGATSTFVVRNGTAGNSPLVVSITGNGSNGYTSNSSFAAIQSAMDAGRSVFAIIDGAYYADLSFLMRDTVAVFSHVIGNNGMFSISSYLVYEAFGNDVSYDTFTSDSIAAGNITAGTFAGQVVANASGQAPGTSLLRNSRLVTADTNPSVNGEICWTYK